MKCLIVNADDFGYTRGVNEGIIRAFRHGVVSSTTIMANAAAFDHAVALSRENPGLGVGCHLVLIGGKALTPAHEIPTLVDSAGNLPSVLPELTQKLTSGAVREEDVERELRAQIKKALDAGVQVTHLDSHHHMHRHPVVMKAALKLAVEFRILRVRNPFEDLWRLALPHVAGVHVWRSYHRSMPAVLKNAIAFRRLCRSHGVTTPEHFLIAGPRQRPRFLELMRAARHGSSELMCHPGYYDGEFQNAEDDAMKRERETELEILTSPEIRKEIERQRIKLISFRDLN